ncbi:hypothetical protein [Brevundimonas sp. GCM10030266]|uniref:hypothetical protein n=1 Tax=Brevundimonas sp. GCM10030266 TaxID=3273386 RepID=UPI003615D8E8
MLIGAGLLAVAATTPWHTDSDAYFAGLGAIREGLYSETPDFSAASEAFKELQSQYRTSKWVWADFGYAAAAGSRLSSG